MIKGLFLAYVILSLVLAMVACGETPATEETAPTLSASTTEPLPSGFSALTLVDNEQFTVRISDIDPKGFIDETIESNYNGDYHRVYIAEIVKTYIERLKIKTPTPMAITIFSFCVVFSV